ncbi:hypothetical protein LJC49_04470 [Ruminococcaceae bacterium OttesenSCG-928-I18]|nr:hypothetical protein [Ruminococcaceae bacterium OttesenSCG-928-I18]
MAKLGDLYIWVKEENVDSAVAISEHAVETGVSVTDHVRKKPTQLNLEGEVVGSDYLNNLNIIQSWQHSGAILTYIGRVVFKGAQIQSFTYQLNSGIAGGAKFDMTLREVRIARNVYEVGLGYTGSMEIRWVNGLGIDRLVNLSSQEERYHTLMAGETLYYVANQYRTRGVTVAGIQDLNRAREVFSPGHQGDYDYLRSGARLLLGVW